MSLKFEYDFVNVADKNRNFDLEFATVTLVWISLLWNGKPHLTQSCRENIEQI